MDVLFLIVLSCRNCIGKCIRAVSYENDDVNLKIRKQLKLCSQGFRESED